MLNKLKNLKAELEFQLRFAMFADTNLISVTKEQGFVLLSLVESAIERCGENKATDRCPICGYGPGHCQCLFGGSAHPDRSKRREVVLDHLYLLSDEQIKHVIELERHWQTSYGDEERSNILESLIKEKEDSNA